MPITAEQLAVLNNGIAAGEVYTGCTAPADFTKPTFTAGVPAGGVTVGMTTGPTTFKYQPEFGDLQIEQTLGAVAPRITKESLSISFTCAEDSAARIKLACTNGKLVNTAGSAGTPTTDVIYVGGQILGHSTTCLAIVSPIGSYDNAGTPVNLYEWVMVYAALVTNGYEVAFKLGENRVVKVEMSAYADPTRAVGDQLFQHGFMSDPT